MTPPRKDTPSGGRTVNDMRLGDLDALRKQFDDIPVFIGMTGGCVQQFIDKQPTIDAAPVVHGQWIKTVQENGCTEWTEFRCSVCGAVFDGNDWLFSEWRGCPLCLTRMDGK